jgi:hypothetical protein
MADERRLNLRFPAELYQQLDEKRFKTRTTFQAVGLHLFEEWLKEDTPEMPRRTYQRQKDPLVEKLAAIRASGDQTLIEIVKRAVEASYGILQHGLTEEDINQLKAARGKSGSAPHGRTQPGEQDREERKPGTRKSA